MQLAKIVVGTDFSSEAEVALAQALSIARQTGAEIFLAHAAAVPGAAVEMAGTAAGPPVEWPAIAREHMHESRARIDEIADRVGGDTGVRVTPLLVDELPAPGLIDVARDVGADLIALGSHGRTGVPRFLLGSVAERVVRHSTLPVLIARPPAGDAGYRRILVPTDFSAAADAALEMAKLLIAPGGTIELLHCWQLPPTASGTWFPAPERRLLDELRAELGARVSERGRELIRARGGGRGEIAFSHREVPASQGIQDALRDGGHSLVVMGRRGRGQIAKWLLGSVSDATVRYSPCSVMVLEAPAS